MHQEAQDRRRCAAAARRSRAPRWRRRPAARARCATACRRRTAHASPNGKTPVLTGAPRKSEQRPDDVEDHEQDEPGAAGVRAVEPRARGLARRGVAQPDDREGDQAEQHGDARRSPGGSRGARHVPDQRDVEVARRTARRRPRGSSAPRMRNAQNTKKCATPGHRPLQQLALPEDLEQLVLGPLRRAVQPARARAGRRPPAGRGRARAGRRPPAPPPS